MHPAILQPRGLARFPDPAQCDDEGLVAVGGDLSPVRLLSAYENGIFPWYNENYPPLWWCPNPRAILPPGELQISRSMRRVLRRGGYRVTWNAAFGEVIRCCATNRDEGTWILPEVIEAYEVLHAQGYAHSIEVWHDTTLVGGLYGVQCGGLFAAESMFHRATNMSKVALLYCSISVSRAGIALIDVQFLTPHLASLGAREIPRSEYLARVRAERRRKVELSDLELTSPLSHDHQSLIGFG